MTVSGEYLSETYYRLLNMELTEALYHAYTWLDLKKQDKPDWAEGVDWQPTQ
ncbi:hypothetical protein [Anabaena sp. CCY 9402-a]|uniref:hypothetical protein n=1 Tax=Anabaena sp. CCY 9402-a TaxID=3103867 RepID=UPI0039C62B86